MSNSTPILIEERLPLWLFIHSKVRAVLKLDPLDLRNQRKPWPQRDVLHLILGRADEQRLAADEVHDRRDVPILERSADTELGWTEPSIALRQQLHSYKS